jgi:hypothetical protein
MIAIPNIIAAIATLIYVIRQKKTLSDIHTLTNSSMTQVQTDLAQANQKIKEANQEIRDLRDLVVKISAPPKTKEETKEPK